MDFDIAVAISEIVPSAEYGGSTTANTQESFELLTWNDSRPKPTWWQIMEAWGLWLARHKSEEKDNAEQAWRLSELMECTSQIHRIEDDDDEREPGSVEQWRAYRKEVRHWTPGNVNYPDKRPNRPS